MADILVSMILFGREEYPHRKFCNSTFHIFTVNTIWNPFLLNNRGFKDQQLYNTLTWEHFFLLSLSNQNLFKRNHIKKFHENTFQLFYYTIECYLENVMWNVAVNKKNFLHSCRSNVAQYSIFNFAISCFTFIEHQSWCSNFLKLFRFQCSKCRIKRRETCRKYFFLTYICRGTLK